MRDWLYHSPSSLDFVVGCKHVLTPNQIAETFGDRPLGLLPILPYEPTLSPTLEGPRSDSSATSVRTTPSTTRRAAIRAP